MSDKTILLLQEDLVGRIQSDTELAGIAVLSERTADLEHEIAIGLGIDTGSNGKAGAMIVVQQPVAGDEMPNVMFGALNLDFSILVLEEPRINQDPVMGTGKAALEIARRVARIIKHYRPGMLGRIFRSGSPFIAPAQAMVQDAGGNWHAPVAYAVNVSTAEADDVAYTKVSPVSISAAGSVVPQTVTLTTTAVGAEIYYTTDGSYPSAANGTLYSAPVSVTGACTLRAAAYLDGSIPSDVSGATYTES